MPSKSLTQQHLMGLALSIKRGKKSLSSLPKGLQSKIEPLLKMTDKQLSDFAKRRLKELIADLINEVITENEENVIAGKNEIEVPDFEKYLKLPQNIGISFTQKEKDATNVTTLPQPFAKSIFEIRYKSTEDVAEEGQFTKTNKTTVLKKIKVGENVVYKSSTLIEPVEKPKQPEEKPTGQQKPELKKVVEITSKSFNTVQGDPELLIEFLKDINEDIGL